MHSMFYGICSRTVLAAGSYVVNQTERCVIKQQVRYRTIRLRKPRWMPMAPTKLYVMPQHKPRDLEEYVQIKQLWDNYTNEMKSIKEYFAEEQRRTQEEEGQFSKTTQEEERAQQALFDENDAENDRIGAIREAAIAKKEQENLKHLQLAEQVRLLKIEAEREFADELVRKEVELSKSFITAENLEAAILESMNNPVTFNYYIDLNGQKYHEDVQTILRKREE